jgi:hypothetical protein
MSGKEIVIEIDEKSGELKIEANGYRRVNGVCQGEAATKFLEEDLGGVADRKQKEDFQGGRIASQRTGNRVQQQ